LKSNRGSARPYVVLGQLGAIVLVLLLSACSDGIGGQPESVTSTEHGMFGISSRDFRVGIAPIPRHFPGSLEQDWLDMYRLLPEVSELVTGQDGDWRNLVANGFDSSLIGFAGSVQNSLGITAMFGINYADPQKVCDTKTLNINWASPTDVEAYKDLALEICQTYKVEYLALAIENNFHYRYCPESFRNWVDAYCDMYDAVKRLSPDTKVFVTFQYEMMRGYGDRYWGDFDAEWEMLSLFGDKLDLVAFTTYPELEFDSIEAIPQDYYAEITKHTNKPVAFTEVGWQKGGDKFIERFIELTKELELEFVLWIFMHDTRLTESNPFPDVGLRQYDGTPKEAWYRWKELKELPYSGR
jgi:hypothetical protein